jgi:uncharacterized protein DUF3606
MRRRARPQPVRNKLNLADPKQVRLLKKRLQLSEQELNMIVGKLGNSISAITKEAATQRASRASQPIDVPAAAVITSATTPKQLRSRPWMRRHLQECWTALEDFGATRLIDILANILRSVSEFNS